MIYRNFPGIYAFVDGISPYKKIFSVIYPQLKPFSGDTSARKFLRFSGKKY